MKEKEVLFERIDNILNSLDEQFALALPDDEVNEETEERESISSAIVILLKQNIVLRISHGIIDGSVCDGWIDRIIDSVDDEVKQEVTAISNVSTRNELVSYVTEIRKCLTQS